MSETTVTLRCAVVTLHEKAAYDRSLMQGGKVNLVHAGKEGRGDRAARGQKLVGLQRLDESRRFAGAARDVEARTGRYISENLSDTARLASKAPTSVL